MTRFPRPARSALPGLLTLLTLFVSACTRSASYTPRSRDITVTMVPLLVRETQSVYPFLKQDFAPGGVLHGKEVYAFSPSTITVVQGDTLRLHLVNPEDDVHTFVLPDLSLALRGQSVLDTTYVARKAGIFKFVCDIPTHLPMM